MKPLHCLGLVLRHALAFEKYDPEVELGGDIARAVIPLI
jgi:hypothetical protein